MDLAAFSPKKFQMFNQSSPRPSARKRSLFPTCSPDSNDLGLIGELSSSDNSNVYSPPLASPSSSLSPGHYGPFSTSPRRSPRIKRTAGGAVRTLCKDNFHDKFLTLLSDGDDGPVEIVKPVEYDLSSNHFSTPKKIKNNIVRSPHSASKREAVPVIKPSTFYGSIAPLLATNQTNRIQGVKCVFRPLQPSRAKAKLLFDDKPKAIKRNRSRSSDVVREAKRRKPVYTGVHHAIPRPLKNGPQLQENKKESMRGKARRLTDLSRTPYGVKRKKPEGWEYTMRFPKPVRNDDSTEFKYFKTSVQNSRTLLSCGSANDSSPPSPAMKQLNKKRMLLDPRKDYLTQKKSPVKPKLNAADISDMVNDLEAERSQENPEVEDILLRLEEDDDRDKKKEAETQALMNLLEDSSSGEFCPMDSLSNCTASLDLNDSFAGTQCSRFSLDDVKENQRTPQRIFSIFNKSSSKKVLSDATNSSRKQKWRGVGEDQLQIDAGQKRFGARQCAECGMVYQVGEAEDEMQHTVFHDNLKTLRHPGWKNEHVVGRFGMDHAIVITATDPKNWQQKAADVLTLVDKSLGISTESQAVMHNQKVFLYISERRVVGCVVAGPISRAYRLLCSESDVDLCSEESFPVKCGISRVWTLFSHRRHGVASRLLDTVRCNFMYGYILPKEEIAFSIPTPAGKRFATKYMGSANFMVYTGY